MARTAITDFDKMTPFAQWLTRRIGETGKNVNQVAVHVGMSPSQLHKIIKSYKPHYAQYQRPGYEKTKAIGIYLGDVAGALATANYEDEVETAANSPAVTLVREIAARFGNGRTLENEWIQEISEELEDMAHVRVERVMRQFQSQSQTGSGKQTQRQKQEKAAA